MSGSTGAITPRLVVTTAGDGRLVSISVASQPTDYQIGRLQILVPGGFGLASATVGAQVGTATATVASRTAGSSTTRALTGSMTAIDQSIAVVPVNSLELARTQFTFLAEDFARHGDVISQTICEIGACAIDKALTGSLPPETAVSPLVRELLS